MNKIELQEEQTKALKKLREIVRGRIVGIMAHGKSIKELEQRGKEFKNYDICWVSLNLYEIMEKFILSKMGKSLDMVLHCFTLSIDKALKINYEKNIRIPKLQSFIDRPGNHYVLSTWRCMGSYYRDLELHEEFYIKNKKYIILVDYLFGRLTAANSLALLIYAMGISKPKKIIMFGMDGFKGLSHKALESYYKPEYHRADKKTCYNTQKDAIPLPISSNTDSIEKDFMRLYINYCKICKVSPPPEIVNCSPNSLFTIFRKINYNQLKNELDT